MSDIPSDVPKLKASPNVHYLIPKALKLSNEVCNELQAHMDQVGVDKHRFEQTREDQSECITSLTR
jgi:hypothetical protein